MTKKLITLTIMILLLPVAFAQQQEDQGILGGFFNNIANFFFGKPLQAQENQQATVNIQRSPQVNTQTTSTTSYTTMAEKQLLAVKIDEEQNELIFFEDAFNAFEFTDNDIVFLDRRLGKVFVIEVEITFDSGSTLITHIIKDNENIFITSEGTNLKVNEHMKIKFSTLQEIVDAGGITPMKGVALILSGQVQMNFLFIPTLLDLQRLPSLQ